MNGAGHIALKEKHPKWFKMKIERRELLKEIPPESAVNVLLACWEYLETMEVPEGLAPMEKIAFYAFFPDMEEAWANYEQKINARKKGGSNDNGRYRTISNETEEETEEESFSLQEKEKSIKPRRKRPGSLPRKERGEYGWVKLTDAELERLLAEFGEAETARAIQYVDESAQSTGNKNRWKDWNLVVRKCIRGKWGQGKGEQSQPSAPDVPVGMRRETGPDGLTKWVRT